MAISPLSLIAQLLRNQLGNGPLPHRMN